MEVKYGLLLKKSWKDMKNNLIIFLPLVFILLIMIAFVLLIILEIVSFMAAGLTAQNITPGLIAAGILVGLIDLLLLILVGAVIEGMYLGLLNPIVTKKKSNAKEMWNGVKRFTGINFKIYMVMLSIFLVPLIAAGILAGLGFLINKTLGIILAIVFGGLYLLYFITAILFVVFGFFFLGPIITESKSQFALGLIKQSLKYTKANLGHVLITWLIIFAINLPLNVLGRILSLPAQFLPVLFFAIIPILIIIWIIGIIINAWLRIFLFNAYFNSKLKKL